jgi:hypothetical protein
MKYIQNFKTYSKISESSVDANGNLLDLEENIFDEFPEDILNTLKDNYLNLYHNFDWNKKTQEFFKNGVYDGEGFSQWVEKHEQTEFIKNLNKIISYVREDLLLLKRKELSKRKLKSFEELIKPVFGNHITGDALTKYEEEILLNPYVTIEQLDKAFIEAKNIIDEYGNIDQSKIQKSTIFVGGEINIPKFEEFVKKNPQYKKTFDVWTKLFDEETYYLLKHTHAFHVVNYRKLRKLYDFLMEYRKSKI